MSNYEPSPPPQTDDIWELIRWLEEEIPRLAFEIRQNEQEGLSGTTWDDLK
jgi:hypothetical protein